MNEESQSLDQFWMQRAIELAKQAEASGEVPVGAVLVKDDQIIGEGFNSPIAHHDPTAHAEIRALRDAANKLGNYRLLNTTLYVTLEPCIMCVGALIHARVSEVVFGACEPRTGAAGSVFDILEADAHNHRIRVRGGLMEAECAEIMTSFFQAKRRSLKSPKA